MLRSLALLISFLVLIAGCTNNTKPNKAVLLHDTTRKTRAVKQIGASLPLKDSAKLVTLLDSLPKAVFPFNGTELSNGSPGISLAEFKNRKLFNLPYKRIPRVIEGAGIDMSDMVDSTFNLCDTNYRASWFLVAKTPKFFAVEVSTNYTLLVTIDYHLKVIDAIHIAAGDPSSNSSYQGDLASTIYKNLKIIMHYTFYIKTDEDGHFDKTYEDDIWHIDKNGRFKPIRYAKSE